MTSGKLGRKAVITDSRTLQLSKYMKVSQHHHTPLPLPPAEVSWVTKVPTWPMLLNDELGDCVIAAMGHMTEQWSFYASGVEAPVTDEEVLAAYGIVGGYVPGDPSTDNGATILDALKYWRKNPFAGESIIGFAAVDFTNITEIFQAIELFGNVIIGMSLPASVQAQDAWTVADGGVNGSPDNAPGSWGGHCVPVVAGSPETLTCITWGERLKMSHNFFADYCDEAYVVFSPVWINRQGLAPNAFDRFALLEDLAQL